MKFYKIGYLPQVVAHHFFTIICLLYQQLPSIFLSSSLRLNFGEAKKIQLQKKMEVPIWQWCLIVIAIIFLAIASHYLGRVLCSPHERIADSKIEKKHGQAAQEKTEKKGGEQLV
ncbi:LOW QUALITY PROTEIN: hypothetical protein N665_0269s0035 [Sinapis alba]|nr:LOW QUALITY PROTEIN: hypothetical protein N665_0269s0035 [Sinapis alba]